MTKKRTLFLGFLLTILALVVSAAPTLATVTSFAKWASSSKTMTVSSNSNNTSAWSDGAAKWRNNTNFKVSTTLGSTSSYYAYDVNNSSVDWDGIASTSYSGGIISDSELRLNTYYTSQSKYTAAIKAGVTGHEVGHSLGLNHTSVVETSSIMQPYTFNSNGTTSRSLSPSSSDISVVNLLYGKSLSNDTIHETMYDGVYLSPSWAVYYKDEEELKNAADLVIKGKVTEELGSKYEKTEYHTYQTEVKVKVDEVLKGDKSQVNEDVIVSQMGGADGEINVLSEHTTLLKKDYDVVLFLRKIDNNTYIPINEDDSVFVFDKNEYKNVATGKELK